MIELFALIADVISLHRPPTSISCNQTDTDKIKLFTKAEDFLYLLSDQELLAIHLDKKREIQVHLIGTLQGFEGPALEIQIENWQNIIVIVLKTANSLHIYTRSRSFGTETNAEPIQKIKTISDADRFVLFKTGEEVMLVTYEVKSDSANEFM